MTCSFLEVLKSARAFSRTLPLDLFMNRDMPVFVSTLAAGPDRPLMPDPSGGVMRTMRYSGSVGPTVLMLAAAVVLFTGTPWLVGVFGPELVPVVGGVSDLTDGVPLRNEPRPKDVLLDEASVGVPTADCCDPEPACLE